MDNKLHLGLVPWNMNAGLLTTQAQMTEAMGFDSFWLPESHFNSSIQGDVYSIPEPLMLLVAVAVKTKRIKLGTLSYLLPLKHPVQAAEQVATLDVLSQGRLILGLGRGRAGSLYNVYGVNAKYKRELFEQHLDIMLQALKGELLHTEDQARLSPVPIQRPHPPLWVAAFGNKGLQQAGKLGLPYLASPIESQAKLLQNMKLHSQVAEQSGHSPIPIKPVMRMIFVSKKRSERNLMYKILQNLEGWRASSGQQGTQGGVDKVDDYAIIGDSEAVVDKVNEYRELLGMTHLLVARVPRLSPDKEVQELLQKSLHGLAMLLHKWK